MLIARPLSLHEYIAAHTLITVGPECDIDVVFFKINCIGGDREEFTKLVSHYTGQFSLSLFNGAVYNFIELGSWLQNEELALRMMALGAHLEVWRLITPRDIAPQLDQSAVVTWAKTGCVAIVVEPEYRV